MWTSEDNTYSDLRRNSVQQWLNDMEAHEDIIVRGGVKVTREYIESLEGKIEELKAENRLKNEYLKKVVKK